MLPENEKLFREFVRFRKLGYNIKPNTELKYWNNLLRLDKLIKKPFNKLSIRDLQNAVLKIDANKNHTGWTKATTKAVVKSFYTWLKFDVSWLKVPKKSLLRDYPNIKNLLTEDDINKLVAIETHPRNKAIIATLYESGCRAGELIDLKISDITFDDIGAVIQVKGKTGQRRLRLVYAAPYLTNWFAAHPGNMDLKSPLWIGIGNTNKHKALTYDDLRFMLIRSGEKAAIKKDINPHQFRHSRATFLASHLTEQQLKVYFGWTQGSDMASVYVHLKGEDLDSDLLSSVYGLVQKKNAKQSKLLHRMCPRCKEENTAELSRCEKCSYPLDVDEVEKIAATDDVITRLKKLEQMVLPTIKSKR